MKLKLEEKVQVVKRAEKEVEGEIKMRSYKKLRKRDKTFPSINQILDGHRWNEVIKAAFPSRVKTIEDCAETARIAKEKSGEESLNIKTYRKYAKKTGAPDYYFIKGKMGWKEFKAKYLDENILEYREIFENKVEEEFCGLCRYQEDCEIELENCEYWREWNENQRENFG